MSTNFLGYDEAFQLKIINNSSSLSQQLLVIEGDYDDYTITFCDLLNLPEFKDNSIDLLGIKHSDYKFLNKVDFFDRYDTKCILSILEVIQPIILIKIS